MDLGHGDLFGNAVRRLVHRFRARRQAAVDDPRRPRRAEGAGMGRLQCGTRVPGHRPARADVFGRSVGPADRRGFAAAVAGKTGENLK